MTTDKAQSSAAKPLRVPFERRVREVTVTMYECGTCGSRHWFFSDAQECWSRHTLDPAGGVSRGR